MKIVASESECGCVARETLVAYVDEQWQRDMTGKHIEVVPVTRVFRPQGFGHPAGHPGWPLDG